VGGFPTATATGSDLAGIARAAGIGKAETLTDLEAFRSAAVGAIGGDELACLVAKVEPVGPKSFHMDLHMLENRFEFQRSLRPNPPDPPDPPDPQGARP
jgi:sulfopyruvate decarboxylase subunit beta